MHVCATASARATIGGPSFESRTPCRSASFQRRTTFSPSFALLAVRASAALGTSSARPPTLAVWRRRRLVMRTSPVMALTRL